MSTISAARPALPFTPPAPVPRKRTVIPSMLQVIRTVYRNPLELWGEPSYEDRWITTEFLGMKTLIVNDPGLIRHVLVENVANYKMARLRQTILRPILRDGLLTAEGDVWKRSRKAMAPVFTPRAIFGFAPAMKAKTETFITRYRDGVVSDIAHDMTLLTYEILAETLFSGEVAGQPGAFAREIETLFETMGRVDPLDVVNAPDIIPRWTRMRGRRSLAFFRAIVTDTVAARQKAMASGTAVPDDFLTLLLKAEGPAGGGEGLTRAEIEDNIITFIGAGHETTARALGWTLYLLANAPDELHLIEDEIDAFFDAAQRPPHEWLDALPKTRAAFEEAMRLYPPAPSINRAAIARDTYKTLVIEPETTVLIMPWTLHRHVTLWDNPRAFVPSRFWPENRDKLDRFQYLPFGAGPRICIGATFALQEAVIALALMLKRFRFEMTEACNPWPVQKLTTQPQGGLMMRVKPR
ncbi:MAG: cytochrome P450 [Rhizobiaceae bacterium]|nr:cytochrome P450 [Rhizobiaceae bacterium]